MRGVTFSVGDDEDEGGDTDEDEDENGESRDKEATYEYGYTYGTLWMLVACALQTREGMIQTPLSTASRQLSCSPAQLPTR